VFHNADAAAEAVIRFQDELAFETLHIAGASTIEVTTPTTASAFWRMVSFRRTEPGYAHVGTWYYYFDTYECIGGAWKIKSTRLMYAPDEAILAL
jgi:hypothetical protein